MQSTKIASTSRIIIKSSSSKLKLFSTTSFKSIESTTTTTLPSTESTPPLIKSSLPSQYQSPTIPSTSSTQRSSTAIINSISSPSFSRGNFLGHKYKLHVFSNRNNTILTLSTTPSASGSSSNTTLDPTEPHVPVSWVSAGSAGYKGASRGTFDAGVECAIRMFAKVEEMINPTMGSGGLKKKSEWPKPTDLEIIWKGFGQGRDAVFRTLMGGDGDKIRGLVTRVTDATPFKIGGTRSRKRRVI